MKDFVIKQWNGVIFINNISLMLFQIPFLVLYLKKEFHIIQIEEL